MKELASALVGSALVLSACSGGHPSPTQPPAARPDTTDVWVGTSTLTAVSGPGSCVAEEQNRYGTMERSFVIDRAGADIRFATRRGPDVGYAGTMRENQFSGVDPGAATRWTSACGTVTSYYGGIEGRFAADERSLAATEFWAARLESGGELRWEFDLKLAR
jgi:hypothetical protein